MGLPFIPIRSLRGSDILERLAETAPADHAEIIDPFTGEDCLVLRPLAPDVAVVQVQIADAEGNAWIYGPRWDNGEQVRAAKRAIVITERLVPSEIIRQQPEQTVIPGFRVSHVVQLPFSAHPASVYRAYDYDADEIRRYAEAAKTPAGLRAYLEECGHADVDRCRTRPVSLRVPRRPGGVLLLPDLPRRGDLRGLAVLPLPFADDRRSGDRRPRRLEGPAGRLYPRRALRPPGRRTGGRRPPPVAPLVWLRGTATHRASRAPPPRGGRVCGGFGGFTVGPQSLRALLIQLHFLLDRLTRGS